jgi:hypothetical protein
MPVRSASSSPRGEPEGLAATLDRERTVQFRAMTLATLEWPALLIGAGVGAILSIGLGLLAASLLQDRVDRLVATAWGWLRRDNPKALPLDGIWRSRYEYTSSDAPDVCLADEHFIEVWERRGRLMARSLTRPGGSLLTIQLSVASSALTGTWRERTPSRREYHGACQFELAPTRDSARGLWTGFSRGRGVLAGPWEIHRVSYDRRRRTRHEFEDRTDLDWGTPVAAAPVNGASWRPV